MKVLKQLGPTDCWRTCVAMILDKDSPELVPHFYESQALENATKAIDDAKQWLRNCGYTMFSVLLPAELSVADARNMASQIFVDYPYILSGTSIAGLNHAVVVCASGAVIDPLTGGFVPNGNPFKGACTYGVNGWIIEVIVPVLK